MRLRCESDGDKRYAPPPLPCSSCDPGPIVTGKLIINRNAWCIRRDELLESLTGGCDCHSANIIARNAENTALRAACRATTSDY